MSERATHFQLVEAIFEALSACAALHPDAQEDDGEGLDDAFMDASENTLEIFTGDDEEELSAVGRVRSDLINDSRYTPY